MRLLLIVILAIPIPPSGSLSYTINEQIGEESSSGFYNVTLTHVQSRYEVYEQRSVWDGGSEKIVCSNESRFGPGLLRYPLLFFDPDKLSDAMLRLVDRILNDRNGTRENYTLNIQHSTINLGGETVDVTGIYVYGERIENNKTATLEAIYRLVNSGGYTYSLSIKVLGARNYALNVKLFVSSSREQRFSPTLAIATLLSGLLIIITLYLVLVRKYRRSVMKEPSWPATSSRIGSIPRIQR